MANRVELERIPVKIRVRANLSKARNEYFTFLGSEGTDYLIEYLNKRIQGGEKVSLDSPVCKVLVLR